MTPFEGIKVLDFSRQAPGPFCTMVLADFGADVIAIEPPRGTLDRPGRRPTARDRRERLYDPALRGKRSIVLDLKQGSAREAVHRLAAGADVLVEGFRPGVTDRLGMGWDALHALNPRLIYCSISGFGQTGPDRLTAGHDIDYIARVGALSQMAWTADQPPAPPMNLLADHAGGGMMAALSITMALLTRERTGEGQYIDVSMADGVMYLMAPVFGAYLAIRREPRPGTAFYNGQRPDYNVYRAKDGRWLALGCLEPHFWRNLCEGLGRPDLVSRQGEAKDYAGMIATFREIFAMRTAAQWVRRFRGKDVCLEIVRSVGEAYRGPLAGARGMAARTVTSAGESIPTIGVGPRLSATPGRPAPPAHQPGEDTVAILEGCGYGRDAIAELLASGAAIAE